MDLVTLEDPGVDTAPPFWFFLGKGMHLDPRAVEFLDFRLRGIVFLFAAFRGTDAGEQRDTGRQCDELSFHGCASLGKGSAVRWRNFVCSFGRAGATCERARHFFAGRIRMLPA